MKITTPKNFILSAASSIWQTEGWKEKKEGQDSFIDSWHRSEHFVWHDGYGSAVVTNFTEQYQQDIDLTKSTHLVHHRTSINWAHFFTDYENCIVGEEYVQHISEMIDSLIEADVEPMICLGHYEILVFLSGKYDSWSSRKVVDFYAKYAKIAFDRYGDRVKNWFTLNEPIIPQTRCYLDAARWPHEQNTKKWTIWNYHKVLAKAKVVEIYHSGNYSGRIGCILNPEMVYVRSSSPEDQKAAYMYDLFYNRVLFDPMVKGYYTEEFLELCRKQSTYSDPTTEDLETIQHHTVDSLGINQYYSKCVRAPRYQWNEEIPFHPERHYEVSDLSRKKMNNSRGWEIYPKIMYDIVMYLKENYHNIPWLITGNGIGREHEEQYMDEKGIVQDDYRIEFIGQRLCYLIRVVEEGVNYEGYMPWAFTDCVSPMNVFKNRYGLVRIKLNDERSRILKKSASWYQSPIDKRELSLPDEAYK